MTSRYRPSQGRYPRRGAASRSRKTFSQKGIRRWNANAGQLNLAVGSSTSGAMDATLIASASNEAVEVRRLQLVTAFTPTSASIPNNAYITVRYGLFKQAEHENFTSGQYLDTLERWFQTETVIYTAQTQPVVSRTMPGRIQVSQQQSLRVLVAVLGAYSSVTGTIRVAYSYRFRVISREEQTLAMRSQGLLQVQEPEFDEDFPRR